MLLLRRGGRLALLLRRGLRAALLGGRRLLCHVTASCHVRRGLCLPFLR